MGIIAKPLLFQQPAFSTFVLPVLGWAGDEELPDMSQSLPGSA